MPVSEEPDEVDAVVFDTETDKNTNALKLRFVCSNLPVSFKVCLKLQKDETFDKSTNHSAQSNP